MFIYQRVTSSHSSRFQTDWHIVRWFHVVSTDFTPQTCQLGWQQCLLLVLLFRLLLQLGFLVIPVESPLGSHGFCVTRVRMELTCLAACEFSSWDIFIPDFRVRPPVCSTGGCSNFTAVVIWYMFIAIWGIAPDPGFIYGVATIVMRALIYLGPGWLINWDAAWSFTAAWLDRSDTV